MTDKKGYALFPGRYQTPHLHAGHLWLFQQAWAKGEKVLIAVRDVEVDDKNPYTSAEVKSMIEKQLSGYIEAGICAVIIIPDIHTIYYGRSVGYDVVELKPPPEIAAVSATAIRNQLKNEGDGKS